MSDRLKAIRERLDAGGMQNDEHIRWLASEVERLSRIEAAAVAYREAEEGLSRDRARYTDAACKPLPEQTALFAALPHSSEETSTHEHDA